MAKVVEPWQRSHADVVHRLRNNLKKKLGMNFVEDWAETRIIIGPGVKRRMDLVTIAGKRTRRGKTGNVLALFEVKTAASQLFTQVIEAAQQLSLYELALSNPSLYITKKEIAEKLSNSLAYRKYVVIQKALLDELDVSPSDILEPNLEKLLEIMDKWNFGIITYDDKWRFKIEKDLPECTEEDTSEWLGKKVGKKTVKKK